MLCFDFRTKQVSIADNLLPTGYSLRHTVSGPSRLLNVAFKLSGRKPEHLKFCKPENVSKSFIILEMEDILQF